jgi:hypothetical protein
VDEKGRPFPEAIDQYRFNVIEGLKGVKAGEFWALFYTGLEKDSFKPGARYLVFANRRVTGAFISGCSLTRELRSADDEKWYRGLMLELRACVKKVP